MKRENVVYKKITIELPIDVYNDLKIYCKSGMFNVFYKDVIANAIRGYLRNKY